MSQLSAGAMPLPSKKSRSVTDKFAREVVFNLLHRLKEGSLVLHEGTQSWHFGSSADAPAEVHVHDSSLYREIVRGGGIAAGRTYFQGLWSSPSLVEVTRLFSANMAVLQGMDDKQSWKTRGMLAWSHLLNRNTRRGSKDNISAHYDLGNDFFQLFLDPTMMYSSALFEHAGMSLEDASVAKLDELCQQLELKPGEHLLEVGTGWGGMAIHAARNYGCKVTTTTISREQYEYACERVTEAGLEESVTVLCEDYRNLTGTYDKLVSIEMIEAVGHQYYGEYFRTCSGLLRDNGKMVIQAITVPDQRFRQARDAVDFIKRYIFPGGCLPSNAVIAEHVAADTDMQVVHLRDITLDYAETLAHWRKRFLDELSTVREQGFSEEFIRMWEYYLCYCEGGFRERIIGTVQMAFAKPAYRPAG